MELGHALDQISEIHGHLAKSEVYRGLGPLPVAFTAALAAAASLLAPEVIGVEPSGLAIVSYWVSVAALGALVCGGSIAFNFFFREDGLARRRTLDVLGQVVPALAAGIGLTLAVTLFHHEMVPRLPGLWAIVYSLGVFSARPYLPRAVGWVGLFYLLAGTALLLPGARELAPTLGMGVTYGLGQLGAALVLHGNIARDRDAARG